MQKTDTLIELQDDAGQEIDMPLPQGSLGNGSDISFLERMARISNLKKYKNCPNNQKAARAEKLRIWSGYADRLMRRASRRVLMAEFSFVAGLIGCVASNVPEISQSVGPVVTIAAAVTVFATSIGVYHYNHPHIDKYKKIAKILEDAASEIYSSYARRTMVSHPDKVIAYPLNA